MIEIEKTYLAKYIPSDIRKARSVHIYDKFFPESKDHPQIRLRERDGKRVLTKKYPLGEDKSVLVEDTIILDDLEYEFFCNLPGKEIKKTRFLYPFDKYVAEIDVFEGGLEGLVVVEVEFKTEDYMREFVMPDFALVDVSSKEFIANGLLAGKSYKDIESKLKKFGYKKLRMI